MRAISADAADTPVKPRMPAATEITKKSSAHFKSVTAVSPVNVGFDIANQPRAMGPVPPRRARDEAVSRVLALPGTAEVRDRARGKGARIANAGLRKRDDLPGHHFGERIVALSQAERAQRLLIGGGKDTDLLRPEGRVLEEIVDRHLRPPA